MSDYLQHWGILGMKWGVRRFQNPDGSLTPEGRERYGSGEAGSNTSSSGNRVDYSSRALNNKPISEMTNQELQMLVNRIQLEQNYARLTAVPESGLKKWLKAAAVEAGNNIKRELIEAGKNYLKDMKAAEKLKKENAEFMAFYVKNGMGNMSNKELADMYARYNSLNKIRDSKKMWGL